MADVADSVIRRGRDTHVNSAFPDTDMSERKFPRLTTSGPTAQIYVFLPLPGVRNRTIESAILSVPVKDSWAAQTLTATPVAVDWGPRKTTFNNRPTLRAGAIAAAQTSKVDGQRVEINVTTHVQAVANGAAHFGWQITTGSSAFNQVYGFNSAHEGSWKLLIDFIEAPEQPSDLAPNGGVVGVKPTLSFDFVDLGGVSTEMAALTAQVNTSASPTGAWDSGEIAATLPEFNLATSAWPTTPVSGTTYYWRVKVKDGAGYYSVYSDWASFIYAPKPTLTITNPNAGLAWDPTPTIAASISTGVIKAWRIRVAKGNDKSKVLYDSGKQPGNGTSSLAHTLPFKDDGKRILKDDATYWLNVRVWDRNDRESTSGDATYTSVWTSFLMDDDATPPPVSQLLAVQVGETPRVRLTWTRATGLATGWVIRRDNEVIARLNADEVTVSGTQFSWTDDGASPWISHAYAVKAIDGGKQTVASPLSNITPEVDGVWLLGATSEVVLYGTEVGAFQTKDRRATYRPLNKPYDVDIVHAFEGVVGGFAGSIDTRGEQDWAAARVVLMAMKGEPSTEVQLVYGTVNVPVRLRNVSVAPSPDLLPNTMTHDVSFEAQQTSSFETSV